MSLVLVLAVLAPLSLGGCAGCAPAESDAGPTDDDAGPQSDAGPGSDAGPDNDAGPGPRDEVVVEACQGAPTADPGNDACVVQGSGTSTLLVGDVLVPGGVYEQGGVLIDASGTIQCVGCDCAAQAADAVQIICPDAVISPGLINAHDHMGWMGDDPWVASEHNVDPDLRWEHRHDWRRGRNGHPEINTQGSSSQQEKQWGELRFVLGGATSINGSGSANGLLRNLDGFGGQVPGIGQPVVEYDTFPLGDSNGSTRVDNCSYPDITDGSGNDSYTPHVAEGIGPEARNEFLCLTSTERGGKEALGANTAIIHGVGLLPVDVQKMAALGMKLIWSPRSNVALYGDTAQVTLYDALGVEVALGTDWMPSGSMNMLRELRCAAELNDGAFGGYFSDHKLWRMATLGAAKAMAMDDAIGVLSVGRAADIAVFRNSGRRHFASVVAAGVSDVALVLRGGDVLAGDAALVNALESGCDTVADVCGVDKRVCLQREVGTSFSGLQSAVGNIYPLFFCDVPADEPSCVPRRVLPADTTDLGSTAYQSLLESEDIDGDGIPNDVDNCDTIFNPVRPVDEGVQGDADGDGFGDVCDPCPLTDGVTCAPLNPDDLDNDGTDDFADNCPGLANADQADADGDGRGDLCDECPAVANPGNQGCPATVYEVKSGAKTGARVSLSDMVVTAVDTRGFFVQLSSASALYDGEEDSAVYVYQGSGGTLPARGDMLDFSGTAVADFYGQIQLTNSTWTVTSSDNAVAPRVLSAAEVSTLVSNGSASPFEALLVEVSGVSVTNAAPTAGPGDNAENELEVTGGLRVDDLMYRIEPFPTVGESFATLRGPAAWRNGYIKLLPRDAADVVYGDAEVAGFDAPLVFAREGTTGDAIPAALTVSLTRASGESTTVIIESSDAGVADVTGGQVIIPAGSTSATVEIVAGTAGDATLTAYREGSAISAETVVRVIAANAVPDLAEVLPATSTIAINGTLELSVVLDLPAPAGGTVVGLSVTGGVGTLDAPSVTVLEDQLAATFTLTAAASASEGTVEATLGSTTKTADVIVVESAAGLVINEVDYDNPGTNDNAEFVELYNGSGSTVDLTGYRLILVNGSNGSSYATINLSGSLASGSFLVVKGPGVTVPDGVATVNFASESHNLQNGDPDAVVLATADEILDYLSYGGTVNNASLPGIGTVTLTGSLKEGVDKAVSLARKLDGVDTDVDADDWEIAPVPTPGASNN